MNSYATATEEVVAEPFMQSLSHQFEQLMNGLLPAVVALEPLDKHSTTPKSPVQALPKREIGFLSRKIRNHYTTK